jgi:hypothetical protein
LLLNQQTKKRIFFLSDDQKPRDETKCHLKNS